jgi:hypothetical protein
VSDDFYSVYWQLVPFHADASAEWRAICDYRPNVILEGPPDSMETVLGILEPCLTTPIVRKRPEDLETLPKGECSLVVPDIFMLPPEHQGRLLEWLDDLDARRQVVSLSSDPLFPMVTSGLFNEDLYYRLNTVMVQLDSTRHPAAKDTN